MGGRGVDDGGVVHRAGLLEGGDDAGHRGVPLADGHVYALHVLVCLVDDRVDGDRRLASLPVAYYELALPAPYGDHRVYGLDARLQRLLHRLALDDAGGHDLDGEALLRLDLALSVQRAAEVVYHPSEDAFPDRD